MEAGGPWPGLGHRGAWAGSSTGAAGHIGREMVTIWVGDRRGKGLQAEFLREPHLGMGGTRGTSSRTTKAGQGPGKDSVEIRWRRSSRSGVSASSGLPERSGGMIGKDIASTLHCQ